METVFLNLLLYGLLALPLYALARLLVLRRRRRQGRHTPGGAAREVLLCLFVVYAGGVLGLLFAPGPGIGEPGFMWQHLSERLATGSGINLVPLVTIRRYWPYGPTHPLFLVNIVSNVLLFVPIGFFLPLLWRRWQRVWKMLLVAVLFPAAAEFLQLFVGRTTDVDDVLLNAAGILAGVALWGVARALFPKTKGLAA